MVSEYYICRMKNKLLLVLTGISLFADALCAQVCLFVPMNDNGMWSVPFSAGRGGDNNGTAHLGNPGVAGRTEETRRHWTQRYLSVSFPLRYLKVTSPYGYRRDPFTGKKRFHGGIDLHARGENVLAMMAGVVVKVGEDSSSGKYIVLRHGNYLVSYCHLSRILVSKGRQVSPAEPVGITGSTGRSTGEHLHVTCKLNGKSIDPRILFRHIKNIKDECVGALKDL